MAYITHKKREDIGLSPYELKFRGKRKAEAVRIRVIDFDLESVRETEVKETEDEAISQLRLHHLDKR